jgi:hypothetical protein
LDRLGIRPIVGCGDSDNRDEAIQGEVATPMPPILGHQSPKGGGGLRIDHSIRDFIMPKNINEALTLKPTRLRELIIDTLRTRPNCSCVRDALPGFVLKQLKIISRAGPREQFSQKVIRELRGMERDSIVEVYKATNVRVRLLI